MFAFVEDDVMRRRKAFTLIELMIVVVIVAILAASAYPIYRSVVSRAYEAEVLSGISLFRTAQRMYRAEYGRYGTQADLENGDLLGGDDYRDMKYVNYSDYGFSATAADTYTIEWDGDIDGYKYDKLTMDQTGNIGRIE